MPILLAVFVSTVLWAELSNGYIWVVLGATVSFGVIGLIDDYRKLALRTSAGLSSRVKFLLQTLAAALVLVALSQIGEPRDTVLIPYFKDFYLPLGVLFPVFAWIVIVGSSNGVNLTDGLDGLAIMPVAIAAAALGLFSWVAGNAIFSDYLGVPYVAGAGELMVICAAIGGAGLGFLWFNSYPAQVFMGDVGALSLGRPRWGTVAIIVRQEIAWAIVGGIFVMEAVSVMVQVASFRLTGKRVFRMAPHASPL